MRWFESLGLLFAAFAIFAPVKADVLLENLSSYPALAQRLGANTESIGWGGVAVIVLVGISYLTVTRWKRIKLGAGKERMSTSDDRPNINRSITTTNQSGGVNHTGDIHVHGEDTSLRGRLRKLLGDVDSRILEEIDEGRLKVRPRMAARHFKVFERLLAENGSAEYFNSVDQGGRILGSILMNGSFGPQTAEAEQVNVLISAKPALSQD